MKIQDNFLLSTNYVNHNRTKVNHDNFFQWKMRYRHNQSKYINASTHNIDEKSIAFEAIETSKNNQPKDRHGMARTLSCKKFGLTRITNEEHTAQNRKTSLKENFLILFHVINNLAS